MGRLNRKINSIVIYSITVLLAVLVGLLVFSFFSYSSAMVKTEKDEVYEKHYVLITEDESLSLWQSVYDAAFEAGKEVGAYVEMMSSTLSRDYSVEDLMEIAIASKVDGIIVAANETEEMVSLINKAYKEGIPVVTLYTDITQSERLSFVGIGNYNLGKEYGNLLIKMANTKIYSGRSIKVCVLIDANVEDSGQNVLAAAIQEAIDKDSETNDGNHKPIEVSLFAVDPTNNFSVEESVRSIFIDGKNSLPNIVVCLSEADTNSIYQAVVDYNQVGLVNILGYYDSEAILKGIARNVIYATVSIDTAQMGQYCVDALSEYYELGNTSQYYPADILVIDRNNVNEYMEEKSDEE